MTTPLDTERLRLRRLTADDLERLVALDADPLVMRFLSGGAPTPRPVLETDILPRMLRVDVRFPYAGFWAVTARHEGAFLGWVGLEVHAAAAPVEAALGYRLRREAWGHGYAAEAARVLIDGLFRTSDVERIVASTYQDNLASQRVMAKLGMRLVRRYRMTRADLDAASAYHAGSGELWDGDDLEYAVERSAWPATPGPAAAPPFVASGSYPVREGNTVRLWVDGEPAFERICRAIEGARRSVWATVTFLWPEFVMPGRRGPALEVLARAAERGVDVRLLFWRPDDVTAHHRRNAFWGSAEHRAQLERLAAPLKVRWDRAHPGFCQHQKTWLIDAGEDDATGFVGGINLNPHALARPGHDGDGPQHHDAYLELRGPSLADVHHNFVQRWNGASERDLPDGTWGDAPELPYPTQLPAARGTTTVQIQRTLHAGRYAQAAPAVGGRAFPVAEGERSVLDQVLAAIGAAHRTLYLENQYLELLEVVQALDAALERGVEVVLVVPAEPDLAPDAYAAPERRAFHEARAALARHDRFALCGLAGRTPDGRRTPVYVHAKLMLVDDAWATVGSANLHRYSLLGNAELNATLADPRVVRAFRVELFAEHLGSDTSALDDVAALRAFRRVAAENRARLANGDPDWAGLAFALDVASYGLEPPFP